VNAADLQELTISTAQRLLKSRQISSRELVQAYIAQIEEIDRTGPTLRSVIEINPDALEIAIALDAENYRGPLHGIPILLKDNIDTADRMETTAGSLALLGSRPERDAFVARRLRQAGAVLLGKSNLSEWANFRGRHSISGWSARGGQARNPYVLDRSPCGSSSGSASAVAANLTMASLGTETDGSILCPGSANGVVGIKPTVGLTSRSGVVPISHSQDTVGPFGRTVMDAAIVLEAIVGRDRRDPATSQGTRPRKVSYADMLRPGGLKGIRIGVPRVEYTGYHHATDAAFERCLDVLRNLGATIIDPANIATAKVMARGKPELTVLLYELKAGMNAYLAGRGADSSMRTLQDLIEFNKEHETEEMTFFGQERFEAAQAKGSLSSKPYLQALAKNQRNSRERGIDDVLSTHRLDALAMPTMGPAFKIDMVYGDTINGGCSQPAALAGYPAITVPAGFTSELPLGLTFMGTAWSEAKLIKVAYAFEQATHHRRPPTFLPTVDVSEPL
jgi:amidase